MSTSDELPPRAGSSRDVILDAAARLMTERGYAGTSISAICKTSGLPPSSVYWHFGSKEGILAAIIDRASTGYLSTADPPDISGATRDQRLDKLLHSVSQLRAATADTIRFLLILGLHDGKAREQTTAVLRQARARIHAWLHEALADLFELDDATLVDQMAALVVAVATGLQIAAWVEDSPEVTFPVEHLKTALTAIADTG
jgi:AcrR family transcriptional regulator